MRPDEHLPACARQRRRQLITAGVDLGPDSPQLHALTAQIMECCHVSPLKAHRLARGHTVRETVDALRLLYCQEKPGPCRLSREQLTHFENGPARPGEEYRDLLCRFYRTGPVQMGWATDYSLQESSASQEPPAVSTYAELGTVASPYHAVPDPEQLAGKRRETLRSAITSAGMILPMPLLDEFDQLRARMDTILGSSTVSTINLDRWEAAVDGYGFAFKSRPVREVLEDVLLDFSDLQVQAAQRQTTDNQKRICRIAARLAGMAGNILADLGHHRQGRNWFASAQVAADETDDRALKAWVRAREATVSLYFHRPAQIAITLSTEARHRAGRVAGAGAALAAATEARAWARLGNADRALDALHQARRISDQLTGDDIANSIYGYPPQQLAFHRAAVLTLVGKVREAEVAQRDALTLHQNNEYVNSTLIRLDQAACTIRKGDQIGGYEEALGYLNSVPAAYRTPLVLSRARELPDLVPHQLHRPLTRNYLEAVDALGLADGRGSL